MPTLPARPIEGGLIWIDLEMTGLKPDSDRIIEIALVSPMPTWRSSLRAKHWRFVSPRQPWTPWMPGTVQPTESLA